MRCCNHGAGYWFGAIALLLLSMGVGCATTPTGSAKAPEQAPPEQAPAQPLVLVVMDPLSKELACACVEGPGQRD